MKKDPAPSQESLLTKIIRKIKNEPFLFVIAITILIISPAVLATGLGSEDLRFVIGIIAALSFTVIVGYYVIEGVRYQKPLRTGKNGMSRRHQPIGDEQIDQVLDKLNQLHSSYTGKKLPREELFAQFRKLFQRDAFRARVERQLGWDRFFFVVVHTELILRNYVDEISWNPYLRLCESLTVFRKHIGSVFGKNFDMARHIDLFSKDKEAFLKNLPKPEESIKNHDWKEANSCREDILEAADKLFSTP